MNRANEKAQVRGAAGAAMRGEIGASRPDVVKLISESLRVRGSVAVRIEPRIFDLHSGARGGYRSMPNSGFTLEIGSAPAVYKTIKLLRDVIELGVPLEIARCAEGHAPVWIHAGAECPVCAERRLAAGMKRALQLLVEKGQADKGAVMAAMRAAAREAAARGGKAKNEPKES